MLFRSLPPLLPGSVSAASSIIYARIDDPSPHISVVGYCDTHWHSLDLSTIPKSFKYRLILGHVATLPPPLPSYEVHLFSTEHDVVRDSPRTGLLLPLG